MRPAALGCKVRREREPRRLARQRQRRQLGAIRGERPQQLIQRPRGEIAARTDNGPGAAGVEREQVRALGAEASEIEEVGRSR